jgi:hypothetical protein
MPKRSTYLEDLLRQRRWQTYATFCRQYDDAACGIDPLLVGRWPSRGQFARWLSGDIKALPHPDHCRVLETMFDGVSAQQLFAVLPAATGQPPAIPAARRALAPFAPSAGLPGPVMEAGSRPIRAAGTPNPPGHVRRARYEEKAMTTEETARSARGTHGGVDHDVLDQLGGDVRQLATDYLSRPPLTLFRPLSQLRAEVFDMLDKRQRPALLPPLYSVAGRLCALIAHASADLGHASQAETHTRTAWLCADLADDDSLRAYVRWVQSNVAYWEGDYRQAAQIARSGQRYATKGSNLLRLASQEARAWAACAESAEVEGALSVVASARDHHTGDDQAGVFRFDPGKAAYYASEVRLALGGESNTRLAIEHAEEALELFESAPANQKSPEFVAAAQLDQVNAHLALPDLEAAAPQLRLVLQLPVECRTQPIIGRVNRATTALQAPRFTHSALALELRDEIALFRAYPARRDLTQALD